MPYFIKYCIFVCSSLERTDYILDESVFALSFLENLAIFDENKDNGNTSHLYLFACIPYAMIRVWGLFLFICFQVCQNLLRDRRKTPHFLFGKN